MYDLAGDVYRFRPLTDDAARPGAAGVPQPARADRPRPARPPRGGQDRLREPHPRHRAGADRPGDGRRGQARVPPADAPGRRGAGDAGPSAPARSFRKQGLKAGPCVHLIALRLAYAEQEAKRLEGRRPAAGDHGRDADLQPPRPRRARRSSRSRSSGRRLKVRWGRAGQPMRLQTLRFNTPDDARRRRTSPGSPGWTRGLPRRDGGGVTVVCNGALLVLKTFTEITETQRTQRRRREIRLGFCLLCALCAPPSVLVF